MASVPMADVVAEFTNTSVLYEDKSRPLTADPGEYLHVCPGIVTSTFHTYAANM